MSARAWWASRPPRERAVLAGGGAAVVAALLFALAWLPMERARTRLAAELPALRASLAEMEQGVALVVIGLPLELQIPRRQRGVESLGRLVELSQRLTVMAASGRCWLRKASRNSSVWVTAAPQ